METYYGFTFLMEHAIVTAVFICSLLIAFLLKKTMGEMDCCW
ncbi:putative membrane protein [Streptococcus pneumoniae GA41277]|nr:putative membrane protein [Streptococcus pneumoniae GA41277]